VTGWDEIRRVMGWDNPNSFGYLFQSGSGSTLILAVWGTVLWWFRGSCKVAWSCLRPGRHDVTDPVTGATHRLCYKHAGVGRHLGRERLREIRERGHLYLGDRPGKG
jgi:hypothetical protein